MGALLILLLAGLGGSAQAQPAGVLYRLELQCPGQGATTITLNTQSGCPVRAIDGGDLMGDPSLAVDPFNSDNVIMASLHGQHYPGEGPTYKSRQGQIFTTFTSQDGGAFWIDNPYYAPEDLAGAYGEHPQVTIDPYGHVYVGSLYAFANGSQYDFVIGAQKFENIDTIDEEQSGPPGVGGTYNAQFITPVLRGNAINQMWFLFNPITDNMTMVWYESALPPANPPCETDSSYLIDAQGYYVKVQLASTVPAGVWSESNGVPDLQTVDTCPTNPDDRMTPVPVAARAGIEEATAALPTSPPTSTGGSKATAFATSPFPAAAKPTSAAAGQTQRTPPAPSPPPTPTAASAPAPATQTVQWVPARALQPPNGTDNATGNATGGRIGLIGVVWTTSDTNTPYYYQDEEDAIGPCSASTNPVLSFGYLYIGCVADPTQGEFRWNPNTTAGAVELFRMDPNGGTPEYMGAAPPVPGSPKLGVRSDGRLALVGADGQDGLLVFSAVFGRYDAEVGRIAWTSQRFLGDDIMPAQPNLNVTRAAIQDIIYREQSGALHVVLKTRVAYTGQGAGTAQDDLGLAPHIQKSIVALDEEYGLLTVLPLDIGDIAVRSQDSTILNTAEIAFEDISDDFLQLPPEPYSYNGQDLGDAYQREFFAIADYGTVLFAEVMEVTTLRAPTFTPPVPPPAPVPSPATTSIAAPVIGASFAGLIAASLAVHRRKNPLAAYTKGE